MKIFHTGTNTPFILPSKVIFFSKFPQGAALINFLHNSSFLRNDYLAQGQFNFGVDFLEKGHLKCKFWMGVFYCFVYYCCGGINVKLGGASVNLMHNFDAYRAMSTSSIYNNILKILM